jgi:hypothetical protein
VILAPYALFIVYLIFIGLTEASRTLELRSPDVPDAPVEATE